MCYPKPGPRCAGHLRDHIAALEARRDEVAKGFMAGRDTEDPNRLNRELVQAREEYEETATARREANARIEAMPEGPEKTAAINALAFAAARWQAKIDAYRDLEHRLGTVPAAAETPAGDRLADRLGHQGPRMSTRPGPGYQPTRPHTQVRTGHPLTTMSDDYEVDAGAEMARRYPEGAVTVAAEARNRPDDSLGIYG